MLLEPLDSLQESILLSILHRPVGRVSTDSKAVRNAAVEVDLVRETRVLQDLFGFMALLSGEDCISLCSSNSQRALDGLQLLRLDEGRVGGVSSIDLAGAEMAHNVLATEAVTHGTDFL